MSEQTPREWLDLAIERATRHLAQVRPHPANVGDQAVYDTLAALLGATMALREHAGTAAPVAAPTLVKLSHPGQPGLWYHNATGAIYRDSLSLEEPVLRCHLSGNEVILREYHADALRAHLDALCAPAARGGG